MGNNPINLALRFFLELFGLFALAYWGWTQHTGLLRFVVAIGLPLVAAGLWGTFRVPGDPGNAPVAVPGILRLGLEMLYFGGAVWALYASARPTWGLVFGLIVLGHYLVSYDRLLWLFQR